MTARKIPKLIQPTSVSGLRNTFEREGFCIWRFSTLFFHFAVQCWMAKPNFSFEKRRKEMEKKAKKEEKKKRKLEGDKPGDEVKPDEDASGI